MTKKGELDALRIKPVKNTMKLHAVVGVSRTSLLTQTTSCYCERCLLGEYCDSWSRTSFEARNKEAEVMSIEVEAEIHGTSGEVETSIAEENNCCVQGTTDTDTYVTSSDGDSIEESYDAGDFVACVYDGKWYVGEIMNVDKEDKDIEIKFMEKTKELFRWPRKEDKIWVPFSNVLCAVSPPTPCGKSQRNYKISNDDVRKITSEFQKNRQCI
jgi:hypothetical protein